LSTATISWAGQSLTVGPEGFQWKKPGGQVRQGSWDEVRSVAGLVASASLEGFHLGTWQHLGIELMSGERLSLRSKAKEAFAVTQLVNHYALPRIVPRLRAQLARGETLAFGPLTLSRSELGYKRKRWPLTEVAGHRTFQGHFMLDVGRKDRPALVAKIMINNLPNHAALRVLLDELCPGSDYGDDPRDLGTVFRPSASSHDPRYPSGRSRLLMLGALLGAGAIAGLVVLVWSFLGSRASGQAREQQEQRLLAAIRAANALPVKPGVRWKCDTRVKLYDIDFAIRGPQGVDLPGLVTKGLPFALSGGSPSIAYGGDFFLLAELRELAAKDAEQQRVATLALQMIETKQHRSVCAGEARVRFADVGQYDVSINLAKALIAAVCSEGSDCEYAKGRVTFLEEEAAGAAGASAPDEAVAPPAKSRPKKLRRRPRRRR